MLDWNDEAELSRRLDRLVDGEMSRADEAQILAQLDTIPEGWKRLALSFVEARRWGSALKENAWPSLDVVCERATMTRPAESVVTPAPKPAPNRTGRWTFVAALSISLLFGAAGGLGLAKWRAAQREDLGRGSVAGSAKPGEGSQKATKRAANPQSIPVDETLTVLVGSSSPDQAQPVDLPLVPVSQIDPDWIDGSEPVIPTRVREKWEQQGRTIQVSRRLYPVQMNDGRRVVIPIDEVEVLPATTASVQ